MANLAVGKHPGAAAPGRSGFTLLELILALSLSVVVVLTITMAINIYWKQFDIRRTNVEEAQLARALLRHVADDLRSAMQYSPADLSGLEAVTQNGAAGAAASAAAAALGGSSGGASSGNAGGEASSGNGPSGAATGGSGQGSSSGNPGGAGGSPGGGSSSGSSQDDSGSATGGFTSSDDPATSDAAAAAVSTVGLYGSATELRMDVSRLPRVDQYEALLADGATGAADIPSDIKTVTYFLRSEESADAADTPLSASMPIESPTTGRGRGLMRREVDRATSAWAETNGGTQDSPGQARLLAEEVVGISFQYFDGTQWLADWDSDQYGGLPLAVEILLVMSDADPDAVDSPLQVDTTTDGAAPTERTYRLVVNLPTATIPTTDPAAEAAMDDPGADPTLQATPMGTLP